MAQQPHHYSIPMTAPVQATPTYVMPPGTRPHPQQEGHMAMMPPQQPHMYQAQYMTQAPQPMMAPQQVPLAAAPQMTWVPAVPKMEGGVRTDLDEGALFSDLFQTDMGLLGDGALMPLGGMAGGAGGVGATRKRARKMEAAPKTATDEEINLRKERNKVHAKRSRLRRKFLLESLRDQLIGLRRENTSLRQIVKQRLGNLAPRIFEECCTDLSPVFTDVLAGKGTSGEQMNETDQKLMMALQRAQQSFTVCSATSPGNTIIFASEGFLKLTGYTVEQVIGRPALFLKGTGTLEKDLDVVNRGIAEGRDTTVCILNYKADGTAFWNQLFVAPLCDSFENPIYFVAVHCDVEECPLDDELQNVVKKTSVDVMEKQLFGK